MRLGHIHDRFVPGSVRGTGRIDKSGTERRARADSDQAENGGVQRVHVAGHDPKKKVRGDDEEKPKRHLAPGQAVGPESIRPAGRGAIANDVGPPGEREESDEGANDHDDPDRGSIARDDGEEELLIEPARFLAVGSHFRINFRAVGKADRDHDFALQDRLIKKMRPTGFRFVISDEGKPNRRDRISLRGPEPVFALRGPFLVLVPVDRRHAGQRKMIEVEDQVLDLVVSRKLFA